MNHRSRSGQSHAGDIGENRHLNTAYLDPEFSLLPEGWSWKELKDIVEIHNTKREPLNGREREGRKGNYPYCGANGVVDHIDDYRFDGEFVLIAEDGGHWGKYESSSYIMRGKFWVNNHAHVVCAISDQTTNTFFSNTLNYLNITPFIGGDARGKLTKAILTQLAVPLPPLPEQKKIAHILSTVQRAIEAQEQIIQTTTELFKSMLHRLMTAQIRVSNGDRIEGNSGEHRDRSDSNLLIEPLPTDWENCQLADVCDRVKDSYKPIAGGKTPYVGLEHLAQDFPAFVGRGTESDIKSSKTAFKIGDILFGKLRPYLRKGVQTGFNGISSTDILVFRAEDRCASEFLKYLVHSDEFIDYAKSTTTGVQHPRTSWPSLREFQLSLPPLPEQKKIAHILSTIQQKVDNAQSKKSKLQDLFRTLLHELMTAKIRVHAFEITT